MYDIPTGSFQSNFPVTETHAGHVLHSAINAINQNLQQVQNHIHPYPQILQRIKEVLLQISSVVFVFFLSVAFVVLLL